jgi:hypothetical protein
MERELVGPSNFLGVKLKGAKKMLTVYAQICQQNLIKGIITGKKTL